MFLEQMKKIKKTEKNYKFSCSFYIRNLSFYLHIYMHLTMLNINASTSTRSRTATLRLHCEIATELLGCTSVEKGEKYEGKREC